MSRDLCNRPLPIILSIGLALMLLLPVVAKAVEPQGTTEKPENAKAVAFVEAETLDADAIDVIIDEKSRKAEAEFTELERAIVLRALTIGGVDYAVAGTQTRNASYGTIRLRGIPQRARLVLAFLYWGEVVASAPAVPATTNINFEGRRVTGRLIGTSTQPCWNGAGVFALYRAVVSHLIPTEIDGDYQVDGFNGTLVHGANPWTAPSSTTLPLAEGATLVVLYTDSQITRGARVYLSEGPVFFSGQVDIFHSLVPPLPAFTQLRHARIGGDGQVGGGLNAFAFATDELTFIGPTTAALVQIRGTGSAFNTDSDWNGGDGGPLNQLWDTNDDDITAANALAAGATSYVVRYRSLGDCIEAAVHILGAR